MDNNGCDGDIDNPSALKVHFVQFFCEAHTVRRVCFSARNRAVGKALERKRQYMSFLGKGKI